MVYLSGVILECPKGPQMVALGNTPLHTPCAHRGFTTPATKSLTIAVEYRMPMPWSCCPEPRDQLKPSNLARVLNPNIPS